MIIIDKSIFSGYLQDNLNRVGAHYKVTYDNNLNKEVISYIQDAFYYKKYKSTSFVKFVEFDNFRQTQFISNEIRYIEKIVEEGKEDILL